MLSLFLSLFERTGDCWLCSCVRLSELLRWLAPGELVMSTVVWLCVSAPQSLVRAGSVVLFPRIYKKRDEPWDYVLS